MASEDKNNSASDTLKKSFDAANAVKSAVKAGKSASGLVKGAAAGPYGAIAGGLWQNRKLLGKIIATAAFILLLPILFILMLPSLIFGGGLKSDSPEYMNVMNDNNEIMGNISEIEAAVSDILLTAHDKIISDIDEAKVNLSSDDESEIIDSYADYIFFNSDLIISQYCASKDNYEDIDIADLKAVISREKDKLFSYTTEESTFTKQDIDGIEMTIKKIIYTTQFVGDSYFADNVFHLTDEQKVLAADYASNLSIFLEEDYSSQSAEIHKSLAEMFDTYPYEWTDDSFNSPFAGMEWKSHITSGFGSRVDPITGVSGAFHSGLDIIFPKGTEIRAAKSGIVVVSEKKTTGYGYRVVINHGGGYSTLYGHCSELLVNVGDTVSAGDVIAKVGATGRVTGTHCHFEVIKDGVVQNPLDFIG